MTEHDSSRITTRPPLVDFTREDASPPALVYIGRDDRLLLRTLSISSAPRIFITGRVLGADGQIHPFQFSATSSSVTSGYGNAQFELAEGFLLGVSVHGDTASLTRPAQVWAELSILRGLAGNLVRPQVLIVGYLDAGVGMSYPPHLRQPMLNGYGSPSGGTIQSPAVGAELNAVVQTNGARRVRTLRIPLTTDATVANRQVAIRFVAPGALELWRHPAFNVQTASTTITYNFCIGGEFLPAPILSDAHGYLPDSIFQEGVLLQTITANLQAGDQFGAVNAEVEDFVHG